VGFTYVRYLLKSEAIERCLPGAGDRGTEEFLFNGYNVSVLTDKVTYGDR
jgi:hypothetical protein